MIGFVTTKWEYGYIPGPQSKISSVQTLQISITSRIGWAYTKQSGFLQRKCNKTSRQAGWAGLAERIWIKYVERPGRACSCRLRVTLLDLVAVRSIHEKCIGLMRAMITSRDLIT
ncbi:hypothetical protein DTO027B3_5074 [Paecilomyces variotii]|nr:hypothetical protein DTO027B3_5074 [Paecilomyces variotii]